jgi:hypothetical protein
MRRPILRCLAPVVLALTVPSCLGAAGPGPSAPPTPSPSIFGVTSWLGVSGTLEVGVAIPLGVWPSLFGKHGQGELAALVGKSEAGLAIGHRFSDVKIPLGKVLLGAAIGIGGVVPYNSPTSCGAGHTCHTGLRATRPVLFVTLPLDPK